MAKLLIKVSEKHGCGEPVGIARWRSIDTGEGDGVRGGLEAYFNVFERRMRERARLRERQVGME